jgi:uncharacterized protein
LLEALINCYYTFTQAQFLGACSSLAMKVEELKGSPFKGLVNVAQLLKEPVGSSRSYNAEEIVDEQAGGSIRGRVTLIHTSQGILVQAELNTEVELTCSRCLDTFLCPINFTIEEEYLPAYLSNSPADVTIDNDNMLDLGEVIRQYILLNLPMKPLCRPDCAGIKEISSYGSA